MDNQTLAWLAGFYEGEGCFMAHRMTDGTCNPLLRIDNTDKDVMERVANIFGTKLQCYRMKLSTKPVYRAGISGKRALELAFKLFPYLGERRRKRISDVLERWEHET